MRRNYAYSLLALAMIIVIGVLIPVHQSGSVSEAKTNETKIYDFHIKASELVKLDEFRKRFQISEVKVVEKLKRPTYKSVTLSSEIQDYLYEKSVKYNFSYEMLLAIIQLESNFNANLVSTTDDYGLTQIHGSTGRWIAKELKLDNYNLLDPKTSIDFSVFYLDYLRTYWKSQGVDDEESLFPVLVISYNRGEVSAKRYIRAHGTESNKYFQKIRSNKMVFEREWSS